MFGWYVSRKAARRRRAKWVGAAVGFSAVAHVLVVAALLLSAMWHVDKLHAEAAVNVQMQVPGAPMDPGSIPAAGETRKKEPKPQRSTARMSAQAAAENDRGEGDGEDGGEAGGGDGDGSGGGACVGPGCVVGPGLESLSLDLPAEDPCLRSPDLCRPPASRAVGANVLEGHRIAGETQIPPPEAVRQRMVRERAERIAATLKVCIDRRGAVSGVSILRGSGHAEWDRRLVHAARGWRYRPYQLESGETVAACGPVTFVYVMR